MNAVLCVWEWASVPKTLYNINNALWLLCSCPVKVQNIENIEASTKKIREELNTIFHGRSCSHHEKKIYMRDTGADGHKTI